MNLDDAAVRLLRGARGATVTCTCSNRLRRATQPRTPWYAVRLFFRTYWVTAMISASTESVTSARHQFITSIVTMFFFQAEDGIRDSSVTGVQTCALPI